MKGRTELVELESQVKSSATLVLTSGGRETIISSLREWTAGSDGDGKKFDGRLHPDYPLYCEGLDKPVCRGMLHLLSALLLPFAAMHLLAEAQGNHTGQVAALLYTGSNLFCYGTSALYHVGKWSPRVEIMLQKYDHCGIAVLSVGTFVPCCLLLFPPAYAVLLLAQLSAICIWTCWHIWQGSSSVLRQVAVPASSFLYLPVFFEVLSPLEMRLYFVCVLLQALGVAVFVSQRPNPWRHVCGYHEIFHALVVGAGAAVYLVNWSIIRRGCDPWVHEVDVLALLVRAVGDKG